MAGFRYFLDVRELCTSRIKYFLFRTPNLKEVKTRACPTLPHGGDSRFQENPQVPSSPNLYSISQLVFAPPPSSPTRPPCPSCLTARPISAGDLLQCATWPHPSWEPSNLFPAQWRRPRNSYPSQVRLTRPSTTHPRPHLPLA